MQNRHLVFEGSVVTLETATTTLPNGHRFSMEIVRHPGGAAIVAYNRQGEICLLRQYRCVLDQWLWELPAGKIDNAENPAETAQRELQEEAGLKAGQWQELGSMVSSPGVFTERVYLYLATELESVDSAIEDSEVFELHWVSLEQAHKMALSGEISDAKSIVGIFRALSRIMPKKSV